MHFVSGMLAKKSRVMHLLLLQNMRYNLEILMKSENQFLLSYLCAETIWKVIYCNSYHSYILQHLWKKQIGKKKWSKPKRKKPRNLKIHASSVTIHISSKESRIFFLFGARSTVHLSEDIGYYRFQ